MNPEALRPALDAGLADLRLSLDEDRRRALLQHLALVAKWNQVYNLTAVREPQQMLTQHLLDCLAAVAPLQQHLAGQGARARVLDVGSGAGFPGVVWAVACGPALSVVCVDAVAKKAAFVAQVAAELGLKHLSGLHARVESLSGPYDLIVSRAFATLGDFVQGSRQALAPGGVWLAMKGRRPQDELQALPADIEVFREDRLEVPGLEAQRCLIWMRPKAGR
jgi:16S rRNA (guanine527-N7)-methyltransferase